MTVSVLIVQITKNLTIICIVQDLFWLSKPLTDRMQRLTTPTDDTSILIYLSIAVEEYCLLGSGGSMAC